MRDHLDPLYESVWNVKQLQSICYECQLDYELYVEILLSHHVAGKHRRPLSSILLSQFLEKIQSSGSLCNRHQQSIQKHEKVNSFHD